jgi:predicted small lipoprotein YifL
MKISGHGLISSRHVASVAAALALSFSLAGCGTSIPLPVDSDTPEARADYENPCTSAPTPEEAGTLVVLDWDGGYNPLVKDHELAAFDITALQFTNADGNSGLYDEAFRAAVLGRILTILCDLEPLDVAVVEGDADDYPGATIVHITGDAPFAGGKQIGQSQFDLCNENPDDAVVVWAGAMANRIGPATFEKWVNAIANTTAHEIGHTLGFFHPEEDTLARMLPAPAEEIMRANTTAAELMQEQRFLLQQNTCPGGESYRIVGGYTDELSD